MRHFAGALATLVLLPVAAAAETAYVTDTLQLGLHRAQDTSDSPFRSLDSGQELEVLSRTTYYAHVQLADGTQGYVKAGFLVSDKPAKQVARETGARYGGVLYVDSLTPATGPAPTYLKLMEYNAHTIVKGFNGT